MHYNNDWTAVFSIALIISNAITISVVMYHKMLRQQKEFIIMCGLSLADALQGVGLTLSGGLRSLLLLDGTGESKGKATLEGFLQNDQFPRSHSGSTSCRPTYDLNCARDVFRVRIE